jgi:purine-binding chemotaxis protein CheW
MNPAETKAKVPEEAGPEVKRQIVAFRVGEEVFGLEIGEVREVLEYREVTPVPLAPKFVAGIISLRGTILAVIDLRVRFGMGPAEPGPETVILVVDLEGRRVGLLADRILDILKVSAEQTQRSQEQKGPAVREYVREILKAEDQVVILLRMDRLIANG